MYPGRLHVACRQRGSLILPRLDFTPGPPVVVRYQLVETCSTARMGWARKDAAETRKIATLVCSG